MHTDTQLRNRWDRNHFQQNGRDTHSSAQLAAAPGGLWREEHLVDLVQDAVDAEVIAEGHLGPAHKDAALKTPSGIIIPLAAASSP